jgi:mannose-6-phosphate isomerase-like protein (cupin superfamily)
MLSTGDRQSGPSATQPLSPNGDPMSDFATMRLPAHPTVVAPDGSDVRVLLGLPAGGMAHFELAAGTAARAVTHRTVDEIWFVLAGRGKMWRKQGHREEIVALEPGVCLSVPLGTHFQFRASAAESVSVVAITMPPWPGESEADFVAGPWEPTAVRPTDPRGMRVDRRSFPRTAEPASSGTRAGKDSADVDPFQ